MMMKTAVRLSRALDRLLHIGRTASASRRRAAIGGGFFFPVRPAASFAVAALAASSATALELVDGDTLRLEDETIRLHGVDAPESDQTCLDADGERFDCGARATTALRRLLDDGEVRCDGLERDAYDRLVATCRAGGRSVNAALVRRGWALAFRRYSEDYVPEERSARAAERGLWAGDFTPPWEHRAARWTASVSGPPDPDCPIKGNINRDGERIYHAPWSRFYDRTRVDVSDGERWFCDESEAREAGWRPPRSS